MEFLFKDEAEDDLAFWYRNDKLIIRKIESLFKSMKETPFEGIGHPKVLKENLQ